jgi:hypothetical protein
MSGCGASSCRLLVNGATEGCPAGVIPWSERALPRRLHRPHSIPIPRGKPARRRDRLDDVDQHPIRIGDDKVTPACRLIPKSHRGAATIY